MSYFILFPLFLYLFIIPVTHLLLRDYLVLGIIIFECPIFVRTIRVHVPLEVNIRFSMYTDNELHPFVIVNRTNLKKDQQDLKASFKIFASSLHLISIIF